MLPVRVLLSPLCFAVAACSQERPARAPAPPQLAAEAETSSIARMLDDWHDAAAHADEARYFGHIAKDGVFLGTDATERWDKSAFLAYAHPRFATGTAWIFRAVDRHVRIAPTNDVAWFDERLETQKLGAARGSGVVVRAPNGAWEVALYDLSIPIPNERFDAVRAVLAK